MIEEAMSITPIVFILIILLFGSIRPDRSRRAGNTITAKKKLERGDSRKNFELF